MGVLFVLIFAFSIFGALIVNENKPAVAIVFFLWAVGLATAGVLSILH